MAIIHSVPTVVITGFLGAGKTTAIRHLLAHKPASERWAVLVNEFGEVGIDGAFISAATHNDNSIFVKEVAGGCICCTAGLPVQIALSQLLQQARPDLLIIEPTGLGHPQQIVETLTQQFSGVLQLQGIMALVDARQITDPRYSTHEIFIQQLTVADVIVASKADCYDSSDEDFLSAWLAAQGLAEKPLYRSVNGNISLDCLRDIQPIVQAKTPRLFQPWLKPAAPPLAATEGDLPQDYTAMPYYARQTGGFYSAGWRFNVGQVFDMASLLRLLDGINAERIKGLVMGREGVCSFNKAGNTLHAGELAIDAIEGRIEIISHEPQDWPLLDRKLRACLV